MLDDSVQPLSGLVSRKILDIHPDLQCFFTVYLYIVYCSISIALILLISLQVQKMNKKEGSKLMAEG